MKKLILALTFLSIVTLSYSQVTQYFDRTEWQNAANDICFTEDFESFSVDTEFRTSPLQLNGFTLLETGVDIFPPGVDNFVDVSPFQYPSGSPDGSTYAVCKVEDSGPMEVILEFDIPVEGFFADYHSAAGGDILMQYYNSDMGMIDSYVFTMNDLVSTGFITTGEPITSIRFLAATNGAGSEGFGMDNIEISCATPIIPTLSQWGIIALSMIMMIFGVVAVRQRKTIFV